VIRPDELSWNWRLGSGGEPGNQLIMSFPSHCQKKFKKQIMRTVSTWQFYKTTTPIKI
jgi:hypothetical protein